jgi:probable phosphoglycerate mutase
VPLYVLSRHAHSELNLAHRVNGDPSVPVGLTEQGREEAARLGRQLANVSIELIVHTRFGRTRETAEIARETCVPVPTEEEPLLDDVYVGELEGGTIDEYRAWKAEHTRDDPFPGGESLNDTARRYAQAFRKLAERREEHILVVCHEIPVRYALNAAGGSDDLDAPARSIPNATPFLFDEEGLLRAAARIEQVAGAPVA